jgi:hypothetical protein
MTGNSKSSPAVSTAKKVASRNNNRDITLPTGDEAVLMPVSASLIDAVTSEVKDPKPPMWYNKDADREEENFNHPDYIKGLEDAKRRRGIAALDAMVMFGIELVDGVPEDDRWLQKLQFMAKRGMLSLDGYDLSDPLDKEFLYKRFVAVDNDTITLISEISGISGEEVAAVEESFPAN